MFCPNCGKDIGDAKFCPNCGAKVVKDEPEQAPQQQATSTPTQAQKPKKRHGCLVSILAFLVFVIAISVIITNSEPTSGVSDSASTGGANSSQDVPDLEVLDHEPTAKDGLQYIVGHIRNNTSKTYSYVQVEINLYSGDTLLGSTLDNVNNLAPGDTWEFSAMVLEDGADKYSIVDVTGW